MSILVSDLLRKTISGFAKLRVQLFFPFILSSPQHEILKIDKCTSKE